MYKSHDLDICVLIKIYETPHYLQMMVKIDNGKDEVRSQSPDLAQMCKKPKLDSFQVDLSDAISYEEDYDDSNPRYIYNSNYFFRCHK